MEYFTHFAGDMETLLLNTKISHSLRVFGTHPKLRKIITYSDIEGDENWIPEGEANISLDPEFMDHEYSDYTLMETSPCIDTGTIIEDMEYCGDVPDMGAYEYCEEECGAELADVTGDGQINVLDLVQIENLVLEISTPAYPCAADYNQDGQVNILDLVQISNYILNP